MPEYRVKFGESIGLLRYDVIFFNAAVSGTHSRREGIAQVPKCELKHLSITYIYLDTPTCTLFNCLLFVQPPAQLPRLLSQS